MKILVVSARYYPEPFTISRILEGLVARGNDVTVLTGRPNYGKWKIYDGYENVKEENINGVHVIRVNERARKRGFLHGVASYLATYRLYSRALSRLQGDFDIVLSHVMSPIFTISKVEKFCRKRDIPQMLYGFDLWPESLVSSGYFKRSSLAVKLLRPYCRRIYNACDLITFASPSAETYFKEYLDVHRPFKHIYQPCLSTVPPVELVLDHTYRPQGKTHILFCGNLARFNHIDLFIDALFKSEHRKDVIFDVVGSGVELERLQQQVKSLSLEDSVIFHGRVSAEETKGFYYNADILFAPLYCNSATSLMIPQKVIEYFMFARPIFGMLQGDGADLIMRASSENVLADQTIESLVEGIERICDKSESQLAKCGEENRHFFDTNPRFTLDTICDEINQSLHETIKIFCERKER